jgi:hypothetical protein
MINNMPGGLLQLLTIGTEDAPLVLNPEITFFKTVYRKHTNFSLEQIIKNIGTKKFGGFHQFKIEKIADLIYGLHFIVDIPYFDILKTVSVNQDISASPFEINEISIYYSQIKTYLFYESNSQNYYLIPENYFNLSKIDNVFNKIDGYVLEKNLFNNLDLINTLNYGSKVDVLTMKNSTLNQILPVLRLYFNQWDEFWLRLIDEKKDFNYYTSLISQINLVKQLATKLDDVLYTEYVNYNIFYENNNFMNFYDEIKEYYSIDSLKIENPIYDCDFAVNYAILQNLDISSYKFNSLQYNSSLILFILQSLYPTFNTYIKSFTFWKKFELGPNNVVDNTIINGSYNSTLEWNQRFKLYNITSYGNIEKLPSQLFETYLQKYNECEIDIKTIYNKINIINKEKLWCTLKVFFERFLNSNSNTNSNICFDDYYDLSKNPLKNIVTNYYENIYPTLNSSGNLLQDWSNFEDPLYIQPVDLDLLYLYLSYNLIENIINNNIFINYHFLVLWRNKLNVAFFFRVADNLDNYNVDKTVSNPLQNVFFELNDYNQLSKNLTFFHNINVQRNIGLDIIRQDLINTINCESFYGTIDISSNELDVNTIRTASYRLLSGIPYSILNQNVEIVDEIVINNFSKDILNNLITINNWNKNIYDQIYIKINNNFVELKKFTFKSNNLYLYFNNDDYAALDPSSISLRLYKNILVPSCNILGLDISSTSLMQTNLPVNTINLFNLNDSVITNNNLLDNKILVNINHNNNLFYQLNIQNSDGTNNFINIDISNNTIIQNLDLQLNNILQIDLISYDLGLSLDTNNVNIEFINNNYIINLSQRNIKNFYWLISNSLNNNYIGKQIFIPLVSNGQILTLMEDIEIIQNYINAGYTFDFYSCNILTPNLFTILHHVNNPYNQNNQLQLNQSFYQQPLLLPTNTSNNLPIYYFYNFPTNKYTVSVKINNKKVNKLLPINSSEFYINTYNDDIRVPVVYDAINLKNYQSKENLINFLLVNFDNVYVNSQLYSDIINLLEQSNNIYTKFNENTFDFISTIGKTSNSILENSDIINDKKLRLFNQWDFDIYSVLAPKFYNLKNTQLSGGIGIGKFKLNQTYLMLTQIKDIYQPNIKISDSLTNYLKNVSKSLMSQLNYISLNSNLNNILNPDQYTEKYDYKYKLENNINLNTETITNFTLQTVFPLDDSSNNQFYFNNVKIDISNNIATGQSLFEIKDETKIITTYFEQKNNDYNSDIFNYLGPVSFGNNNFIFPLNIDFSSNYVLNDEEKIINIKNQSNEDFIIYKKSYLLDISFYKNINSNETKYVYQVSSSGLNNLSNNSILINNNFYTISSNNVLVGNEKLDYSVYAIVGNSTGNFDTFVPFTTILIEDMIILNSFKTNIYESGIQTDKATMDISNNYHLVQRIFNLTTTYYSILTNVSSVTLYDISKSNILPPCKIINNTITIYKDNQDFIINTFNNNYYYKFDNYIVKGTEFTNIDLSGNFDFWMYPNNYLKLVDLSTNVDISNGKIYFDSSNNLFNYSYYSVNGYIHFIKKIDNGYQLDSLIINDVLDVKLYLVSENNFKKRDSYYSAIIDTSSSELLVPNIDSSPNISFSNQSKIISSYGIDFKNNNRINIDSELEIILQLTDGINNMIKPLVFTSDDNIIPVQFVINNNNFGDFLVYTSNDTSNNFVYGSLSITNLISKNNNLQINGNNFILTSESGLKKYKIYDSSQNYSYLWTLKVDIANTNYVNISTVNQNLNNGVSLIKVSNSTIIGTLNGYTINNILPDILDFTADVLTFNNSFNNLTRQQVYYNTILLNNNNHINKLEFNHNSSDLLYADLDFLGSIQNIYINGNELTINIDSSYKYLILISSKSKIYTTIFTIKKDKIIINDYIDSLNYTIYGSNRDITLTKNVLNIVKNQNIYLIHSKKNLLINGDIIMVNDNIFEIIGLNTKTLLYEANLIKKINNINTLNNGYYLLYKTNKMPTIPDFDPIVEFTINNNNKYKFLIDSSDNLVLDTNLTNFSINESNQINLYFNQTFFNPYKYLLNIGDYIYDISNNLYQIKYINQDSLIIYDISNNIYNPPTIGFYIFTCPYQPCVMENLIFDASSNITNYTDDFYFEYNNIFVKNATLSNTSLYTRVLKIPKQKYYFENNKNTYINGIFNGNFNNQFLIITEDLSGYDFFYEQPILVNSIIKFIKNITYNNQNSTIFTLSDGLNDFNNYQQEFRQYFPLSENVKVYFSKRDLQFTFCNYSLDKTNYLKPSISSNVYHNYYLDASNSSIINYDTSSNYSLDLNMVIFQDNILSVDTSNNFINLYKSYHILLEKTSSGQYVSNLCYIDIQNNQAKIYLYTPVESYSSSFYLDKIYPIIINVDNTFNFIDLKIYKQKNINTLPSNELIIWKEFNIIVTGLVETTSNGYSVEVEIGDLSNYIYSKEIYIDKNSKCNIYFNSSSYYLITSYYPGQFNSLYTKEINYIKTLIKNEYTVNIYNNIYNKSFNIESIKLPINLITNSAINNLYNMDPNLTYIDSSYNDAISLDTAFSVGNLNLNITQTYINDNINKRVIQTNYPILNLTTFYINNHFIDLFDESTIQLDINTQLENIISNTNFKSTILFNSLKTWNTWSILTNPENEIESYLINGNIIATYDSSNNIVISLEASSIFFTKSELQDISSVLANENFSQDVYLELSYYTEKVTKYLDVIYKYNIFWENPVVYLNNFAIDISSDIIFDGSHLYYNNIIIDKCILNNQFNLTFNSNPFNITVTRNIQIASNEITNFMNNIPSDYLYGINILDVLKKTVELGKILTSNKSKLLNFNYTTQNFSDMLLNLLKNKLYDNNSYSEVNNTNEYSSNNISTLKNLLATDSYYLQGIDVKKNYVHYDSSNSDITLLLDYPISSTSGVSYTNIPYNNNYSIDTPTGLFPFIITLTDETFISYTLYQLDFLEGIYTLSNNEIINDLIIYNSQIQFYYDKDLDINNDININAFKTYDCSFQFIGYLYDISLNSTNLILNNFATIKYKNTLLDTYNNLLLSNQYLESLTTYIQAETTVSVYDYEISNNKTIINLINLNVNIDVTSPFYTSFFYNDGNYYGIELIDMSNNIVINANLTTFKNTKIIITIKATNIKYTNKIVYRLYLTEPLVDYLNYISLKNVLKNFMLNDKIQVLDLVFISDSILDVIVDSSIGPNYQIQNIVHYVRVGEYPPEPIMQFQEVNLYLYQFNEIIPYNDISSCFIYYDPNYNNHNINEKTAYIKTFLTNINNYNYVLSNDIIKNDTNIQYVVPQFILDDDLHRHTFGGVINNFNISDVSNSLVYDSSNNIISFIIPDNLVFDASYNYIVYNQYLDISNFSLSNNKINIYWPFGDIPTEIIFKQVIIEETIIKPKNNQFCKVTLFENFDLNTNGYLQATDRYGNALGQFVYKFDIIIQVTITDVFINNSNIINGQILYTNPLCIITNELINNFNSITIRDSNITLTDVIPTLIQKTYIPFNLYKMISLTEYILFIRDQNIFDNQIFNFNLNSTNYYSLISRYSTFQIQEKYENQQIAPNPILVPIDASSYQVTSIITEQIKFDNTLYKKLFEYVEFMIGDQSVEILTEDIMDIQYQLFKDPNKKSMFNKVTKIYKNSEGNMRLIIPLEFWFAYTASLAVPLISLPFVDVSVKFKLNSLSKILGFDVKLIDTPEINIQLNIDGILLDSEERNLFAKNQHEYLIERFKQYPDCILGKVNTTNRLVFKNLVKDIYLSTLVSGTTDKVFYNTSIIIDQIQQNFNNDLLLYQEFLKIGVYTDKISKSNANNFKILRSIISEVQNKSSERYIAFMNNIIIKKYNILLSLYFDSKYQSNLSTFNERLCNLIRYYGYIYKYEVIQSPISPIVTMNLKAGGGDLFRSYESDYFNVVIPYQKFFNSIDPGYYVYTFSLYPLDKQPSGHINFSVLDDLVVNTTNNSQVVTKPVILKTMVKEYQIIRIMSGMASLAWTD